MSAITQIVNYSKKNGRDFKRHYQDVVDHFKGFNTLQIFTSPVVAVLGWAPMILFLIVLLAPPTFPPATLLKAYSDGFSFWIGVWRVCYRESNSGSVHCRKCCNLPDLLSTDYSILKPPRAMGLVVLSVTIPGLCFFPIFFYRTLATEGLIFGSSRELYAWPMLAGCVVSLLCWLQTYVWFDQAVRDYNATKASKFRVKTGMGFMFIWIALGIVVGFWLLWSVFSGFLKDWYMATREINDNQGDTVTVPFVKEKDPKQDGGTTPDNSAANPGNNKDSKGIPNFPGFEGATIAGGVVIHNYQVPSSAPAAPSAPGGGR